MEYIAFDIETTGFLAGADQIVELAGVRFKEYQPVESFVALVDPGIEIPAGAQRIHGISNEMVKGKPSIEKVLEDFAAFCGDTPLVAHNAPFDAEFLKTDILKFESPAPKGKIFDTCAMARKVLPGMPNYKLGTLVDQLKIPSSEFHRAEADSRYCGFLFGHMILKIFQKGEPIHLENLINLSGGQALQFPQVVKSAKQLDLFGSLGL